MKDSSETISIDLENDDNIQKLIIPEEGKSSSNMSNCCLVIVVLILLGPVIILDAFYFYYSFNGGECGNKKDGFGLTINDYLLGQAIYILMMLFIIIGIFLCTCVYKDAGNIPYKIITYPMIIFSVAWLTIGCVVYWAKTDTYNCTSDKNTFIFITIIFSIVGLCTCMSFSCRRNRE
jgi:hypothetical protein